MPGEAIANTGASISRLSITIRDGLNESISRAHVDTFLVGVAVACGDDDGVLPVDGDTLACGVGVAVAVTRGLSVTGVTGVLRAA